MSPRSVRTMSALGLAMAALGTTAISALATETIRVSVGPGGAQGNSASDSPALSANGRFVAFASYASNLVSGDTNKTSDVFVHDRQRYTTTRVSLGPSGAQGNAESFKPVLSANGGFVAFTSLASNLVPGDTNGTPDIFVRDRR